MSIVAKKWYEVHSQSHDIDLILESHVATWLRCNIWHVRGKTHDLLVDSGMGLRSLKEEIVRLNDKPVICVSTHCHFDHMGGAHEFDLRLGHICEQHVHRDPEIENGDGLFPFVRAETFSELPYEGFHHESYKVTPAPLTGYLNEGDVIDLGNRHFRVFHVPGHSPGSIALFEEKTGILFSGDTIYNGDLYDTVYNSDISHLKESLFRLKQLPITVVHGGHFESFDKQRMRDIIDLYNDGKCRIKDDKAWVEVKIKEQSLDTK